jgi:hypothetical protein
MERGCITSWKPSSQWTNVHYTNDYRYRKPKNKCNQQKFAYFKNYQLHMVQHCLYFETSTFCVTDDFLEMPCIVLSLTHTRTQFFAAMLFEFPKIPSVPQHSIISFSKTSGFSSIKFQLFFWNFECRGTSRNLLITERLWGPPSLLSNGYQGLFPWG